MKPAPWKLILITPIFILLSHYPAVLLHEFSHSFMAWALGFKTNPFALNYGGTGFWNLLLLINLDQNVNNKMIYALGHPGLVVHPLNKQVIWRPKSIGSQASVSSSRTRGPSLIQPRKGFEAIRLDSRVRENDTGSTEYLRDAPLVALIASAGPCMNILLYVFDFYGIKQNIGGKETL